MKVLLIIFLLSNAFSQDQDFIKLGLISPDSLNNGLVRYETSKNSIFISRDSYGKYFVQKNSFTNIGWDDITSKFEMYTYPKYYSYSRGFLVFNDSIIHKSMWDTVTSGDPNRKNGYGSSGGFNYYLSTDDGDNWKKFNENPDENISIDDDENILILKNGSMIQVKPPYVSKIYIENNKIKSTQISKIFDEYDNGGGASRPAIIGNDGNLYAKTNERIWVSYDNGYNWVQLSMPTKGGRYVNEYFLVNSNSDIYVNGYVTEDTAKTWTLINQDTLGVGINTNDELIALVDDKVFISTNFGISWTTDSRIGTRKSIHSNYWMGHDAFKINNSGDMILHLEDGIYIYNNPSKFEFIQIDSIVLNEDSSYEQNFLRSNLLGNPQPIVFNVKNHLNNDSISVVKFDFTKNKLKIYPKLNYFGEQVIKIVGKHGINSDSVSFKLTVNPIQDAPTSFAWTSTLTDSIQIKKDNLNFTYDLTWGESKDVDGDTIVYMVYAKVGNYEMEEILDTTATSYSIPYSEIIEGVFTEQPIDKATVRFTVWASDGTDSVKVDGEDRVLFVDIYQYLSTKEDLTPTEFALHDNYPNPFNPTTQIRFDLPQVTDATLTIYNMMGQKIRTFSMSSLPAGYHNVTWNATNDYGQQVSAGVYLYQLQTKGFMRTKKMILLK